MSTRRRPAAAAGAPGRALRGLGRACHPEPTVAVTAASGALAAVTGRSWPGILAVVAAVLAGQLSVGWCNDYVDRDRDRTSRRADKPVAAGDVSDRVVGAAACVALVACVPLSLLSGVTPGVLHLAAVGCAWAYNLGVKATALSVLPYTVAFGLLPAYVVMGLPGHPAPPVWLVAAGALLGSGAHLVNVLPDLGDDLRTGVRGLAHRIGAARSRTAAGLLLLAATVVLTLGPPGAPGPGQLAGLAVSVAVLAGGIALGRRAGSRAAFRAVLMVAVVDVALLLVSGRGLT